MNNGKETRQFLFDSLARNTLPRKSWKREEYTLGFTAEIDFESYCIDL